MGALVRYSAALVVAFSLAGAVSYYIIVLFIPGFESMALLPYITGALFIPLGAIAILLARWLGQ